jgi:hypothetical protein
MAPPRRVHLRPGKLYTRRNGVHGMTETEYVSYWKLLDSDEYPASVRKAINEFDLPTFWEDMYELSMGAYGDDRAVDLCVERLEEYRKKHPVRRFGHSTKRCTSICWDLIEKVGWDFRRAGGTI